MDPDGFESILSMIINHDQFQNMSSSPQAPILLQFMVALFYFGRIGIMICDVSNQFGILEGVVHLFTC